MTDMPSSNRKRLLFATGFAALLQMLVMVLIATDRISSGLALALLGIVVIVGILPPSHTSSRVREAIRRCAASCSLVRASETPDAGAVTHG